MGIIHYTNLKLTMVITRIMCCVIYLEQVISDGPIMGPIMINISRNHYKTSALLLVFGQQLNLAGHGLPEQELFLGIKKAREIAYNCSPLIPSFIQISLLRNPNENITSLLCSLYCLESSWLTPTANHPH
jgi:hypothetical protein